MRVKLTYAAGKNTFCPSQNQVNQGLSKLGAIEAVAICQINTGSVALSTLPFAMIALHDQAFFLQADLVLSNAGSIKHDSHAFAIMQSEKLANYGVIRRCRSGYKIGPL